LFSELARIGRLANRASVRKRESGASSMPLSAASARRRKYFVDQSGGKPPHSQKGLRPQLLIPTAAMPR